MKRPTKHLSDVDLNGRIRRRPTEPDTRKRIEAKFLDGPLADQTMYVPKGVDRLCIGAWIYTYAGKDGRTPLYCKQPKSRAERRLLMFLIAKRGSDPRREMSERRTKPITRTRVHPRGKGAMRRAEKRAHAAA